MKKTHTLWITQTAVLTALLISAQAATAPLGMTLVTGSLVNMILAVAVMTCGFSTGVAVGLISPVVARLLGIGTPFWTLVPIIAAANILFVFVWRLIGRRNFISKHVSRITALVSAAVCKFALLYIGVVRVALPLFMELPEKQAAAISTAFSLSQLFTALIGGALAFIALPAIEKAVGGRWTF